MMKNDIQILKYQEYKDAVNEDRGKTSTYKNKRKEEIKKRKKWAVIVFILYLLSFLADLVPEAFTHIERFINQILNGLNF